MSTAALHRLLAWNSMAYPTGAFNYSHGLEWAVEAGAVQGLDDLVDYIAAVLLRGGGWVDAVLFVHAWRAAGSPACLDEIAQLAASFRASAETALEARQQGRAFLEVTRRAWPHPALEAFAERQSGAPVAHCVVAALTAAVHDAALESGLGAFLHALTANLVSAGARLIPLGQTHAQIAITRLVNVIEECTARAQHTALEDLGTSAPELELFSMHHETQYTRLFRS